MAKIATLVNARVNMQDFTVKRTSTSVAIRSTVVTGPRAITPSEALHVSVPWASRECTVKTTSTIARSPRARMEGLAPTPLLHSFARAPHLTKVITVNVLVLVRVTLATSRPLVTQIRPLGMLFVDVQRAIQVQTALKTSMNANMHPANLAIVPTQRDHTFASVNKASPGIFARLTSTSAPLIPASTTAHV